LSQLLIADNSHNPDGRQLKHSELFLASGLAHLNQKAYVSASLGFFVVKTTNVMGLTYNLVV
jgi:hypothetical protein